MILLELTRCFQGVLVDHCQFFRIVSYLLTMKETGLSKRQEIPPSGPPSPRVAGPNPRSTRRGKRTSAASSQGALVHQDTLKTTRELQKNHHVNAYIVSKYRDCP
jgi:hypothetical protein